MCFYQSEKKQPPRRLDFTSQIYILYPISKPVSGRGYKSPVIGFDYSGFMVHPPPSLRRTQLGFCYPGWKVDWEAAPLAHHPFQAQLFCLGSESIPASWRTLFLLIIFYSSLFLVCILFVFKLIGRRVYVCCLHFFSSSLFLKSPVT